MTVPRRTLRAIALLMIVIALPSVSAAIIEQEYLESDSKIENMNIVYRGVTGYTQTAESVNNLVVSRIEDLDDLSSVWLKIRYEVSDLPVGRSEVGYKIKDRDGNFCKSGHAAIYKSYIRNAINQITQTEFTIFFLDWDNSGLTGPHNIEFDIPFVAENCVFNFEYTETGNSNVALGEFFNRPSHYEYNSHIYMAKGSTTGRYYAWDITVVSSVQWRNKLYVENNIERPDEYYKISLKRYANPSTFSLYDVNNTLLFTNTAANDLQRIVAKTDVAKIEIVSPTTNYTQNLLLDSGDPDPDDPDGSGITVYIKNSQTGALIANANVVIDALVDGEYGTVTNRTEPSGIFTITLQPTGGGKPNPDSYRLIVTADGYNNPMPEINFTLGDYRKYFECFLDPIAGGPVNQGNTFIDFFVRDMSSNPISGATVKFGNYTLITNSAGYTVFEVEKNNNYTWTISKSGYGPLTGNAVIGGAPRHTINTVLAPIVTPTTTTPIPTSPPIGPTPTMTAPTGEPVSNWLEWFAAHFGMILGGGVEIGKIFMWLCFTVPVGVYVGKESKAGAAGFMAGAGIVTLFFVLIGWVPIWLVVLLALIIGLLYAKVFNAQDNGGGR